MELENNEDDFDLRKVKWRMLSLLDIKEFKIAAQESTESNYEYLAYGAMFESISPFDYAMTYSNMLYKDPVDHYGLLIKERFWAICLSESALGSLVLK